MTPTELGWGPRAVAAMLALLGVAAAAAVVLVARSHASLEGDVRTRAAAADVAPVVAAALRTTVDETQAAVASGAVQRPLSFAEAEQGGVPREVAVRARDTGRALLFPSGVVAATYDAPQPPVSVAERRATVSGLTIVRLEIEETLSRLRPPDGGIRVSGSGELVAAVPDLEVHDVSTYSIGLAPTLAPDWQVTVWTPEVATPVWAWAGAAALALLGIGGGALVLRREGRAAATGEELRVLRRQSDTVSELAAVAQQSLDLADVLPAVSTRLTEALGLHAVALTNHTSDGERPFFATGEPPDLTVAPGLPPRVVAGQTVALLLSRGDRTVARLSVVAGRDLESHEVGTLAAVAEILASALANAEAFAQQRELLARLRAVDELKTVFLATASHELRTPVSAISGFARLLSDRVDVLEPAQIRTFAERVDGNAQQLAALVENLLDFSRLERGGGVGGEQVVLDLGEAVARILDQQPDLAATHVVTRHTVRGLLVLGTEHAVERVLTNLVGNAGKYSPAGTTIRVRVQALADRAQLVVDDEGAGVPAEDRDQIFSRFFRGRGDAVINTRGAGLGLAIVREFAASMGGEVSVSSAPTGGARFMVTYPLAEQEQPLAVPQYEGEAHVTS